MARMIPEDDPEIPPQYLFTAPWDPVVVRRGDALGLRALADQFADAIAPDLNNRIRDGRWVTILSWCLARSQEVFHASGSRMIATRLQQRDRYAWLRPLELMWVARTIVLVDDWKNRSLAGQRRVSAWLDGDKRMERLGMSIDQFRAYRQTGMYGGYRLAFRKLPGMTIHGDGWTPGIETNRLAKWLDCKLGAAKPQWSFHGDGYEDGSISSRSIGKSKDECSFWLRNWMSFEHGGRKYDENTLPRPRADYRKLPEAELLKPLLFGNDQRGKMRQLVAQEVARSSGYRHIDACRHLGRVLKLPLFPLFSRLADAGMDAMEFIADSLQNRPRVPLVDIANQARAATVHKELVGAAVAWKKVSVYEEIRHIESAHLFADRMHASGPIGTLRALLRYHEEFGGGLLWFVLRDGQVETRTPSRGPSSRYRFRLWSLCRLATQCGVLRSMPKVIRSMDEPESDSTPETGDE